MLSLGHRAAIGCTAAFAFAGVLALAAIVARLATALALARVLALTSMLFFSRLGGIARGLSAGRSQSVGDEVGSLNAGASGEQAGKSSTRE